MKTISTAALVAVCALAGSASADVVNITSNGPGLEGNGAFTGSISYTPGTLVVTLTNEMSSNLDGKITGFAFNIGGNAAATLSLASHSFLDLGPSPSAPPFGTFEAGAALGGDWTGGGSPNAGIVRGATGTFTFNVTGAGAGSLSASSFISSGPSIDFVVRFRGFANGGSDKTPGFLVPAPGSLAALGLALAVGSPRRRR